ncbi:MAG: MBL fold metallo-hydrolase [Gammaproteobacteria bacterium]|uniref:MBL fold metallo-hydrolase n=1 Tax=Methylotuvimicrobium sp. TaxID=2822413 RepID=UPI001DBAB981|nr:MBL fold metallo-hydrolase [Gammaproteobacteria bacterium]
MNQAKLQTLAFTLAISLTSLILVAYSSTAASRSKVQLQVLGAGGPEINDRRAGSSYLLRIDDKAVVMIDTGPGSSLNFEKSGADFNDLQALLFTHFHVDHSSDFPALVKGSYFTDRKKDLPVYGPSGNDLMPSTKEFIDKLFGKSGIYRYLNEYINSDSQSNYKIQAHNVRFAKNKIQTFNIAPNLTISAISVHHGPLPALAWRIDAEDCSIVISGDTSNEYNTLIKLIEGSDLLIAHHAIPEQATGAARNLHMPPSEIGKITQAAKVKHLVLSHRMRRTEGSEEETSAIIRKYFPGPIDFADDLESYPLTGCGK